MPQVANQQTKEDHWEGDKLQRTFTRTYAERQTRILIQV